MPRKPRFFVPGMATHVVQRGNNRQAIFFDESDYIAYLGYLREALEKYECQLHAYVLMTNHVHLLLSSEIEDGISRVMQYVGRCYVPYINHKYGRSGTLWEGRYKASLIDSERYFLICMRYIECNPVRAGMVEQPGDYRWSSYHANAGGRCDLLLTPHQQYLALGSSNTGRTGHYKELFKVHIEEAELEGVRAAWHSGTPLGNDHFREEIEHVLKQKVGYSHQGRPKKD